VINEEFAIKSAFFFLKSVLFLLKIRPTSCHNMTQIKIKTVRQPILYPITLKPNGYYHF